VAARKPAEQPKPAVINIEDYKTGPEDSELTSELPDGLVLKAQNLPNLDNRPSVLGDDLPQGLVVEGRKSFAIPDAQRAVGIRVANPRLGEWVQSRPGLEYSAIMYAIKDGNTGIVHPVPESLVQEIPQLAFQAKLWDFRIAVNSKKQPYLWPVPIGGLRLTPSDQVLREAQEASCGQWVTIWFDGVMWNFRAAEIEEGEEELPMPEFPDEPFPKYLARAIKKLIITSRTHNVIKGIIRPT
jgi:hypothetical protein